MLEFYGVSASPGIAYGEIYVYIEDIVDIPKYNIKNSDVEEELIRYKKGVARAADEINDIKMSLPDDAIEEQRILEAHLCMVHDPMFSEEVALLIRERLRNAEWVVSTVTHNTISKLEACQDSYLKERVMDIKDVTHRILDHIMYKRKPELSDLPREAILVTRELTPSDLIKIDRKRIRAIVMDEGGMNSHTAIIARSFGIPAVFGLHDISQNVKAYQKIVVDGNKGTVVIDPSEEVETEYRDRYKKWHIKKKLLQEISKLNAKTLDGKVIQLKSNIEFPEEIKDQAVLNSDGIGLFRSEFLVLESEIIPSEELQVKIYSKVISSMAGKGPVTVRTYDIGGDKLVADIEKKKEKNPLLGWRAVRYCLDRDHILRVQLRALLRASVKGELRIMFPFVSVVEEIDKLFALLKTIKGELDKEKIPYSDNIKVGIMIEVPSAAILSDVLAKKVDFFSVGTNDLTQYTLAVDRDNELVEHLYSSYNLSIIRLLKMIVENGHKENIPVAICGEFASKRRAIPLLLALGFDELSMNGHDILEAKSIIRSINISEIKQDVMNILDNYATPEDIRAQLGQLLEEKCLKTDI